MNGTRDSGVNLGGSVDSTPDQKVPKYRFPLRKYYKAVKIYPQSSDPQFPISSKITSISSIKHKNLNSNNDLNQSKTIILFDEEGNTKESIVSKMQGTPHPQKLFFDTFAKQRFIAEKNLETSREKPKVARNLFLIKDNNASLVDKFDKLNTQEEFSTDDEQMKE